MPYMIYQQYASAIQNAYAEEQDLQDMLDRARECRLWLSNLRMDATLRDPLVEQITWIEEAFQDLQNKRKEGGYRG